MEQLPAKRNTSLRVSNTSGNRLVRDIAESLGKLPPSATDLEEAILGAIMLGSNALNDVAGMLRPDHFYTEQHQEIYQAIQDIYALGDPIDMRTVVARLRKNGKLELIGGAYYIAQLTEKVSSAANIEYHVRLIQEFYLKRQFIQLFSEGHQKAYDDTADVFEMINWTNQQIQNLLDKDISGQSERPIKDIAFQALQEMQGRMSGVFTGLMTGFAAIDEILHGMQRGNLHILGARPSMGKSILAAQIGMNLAKAGTPVGIFSLEMPDIQIIDRMACAEAEIDNDKIATGKLTEFELQHYTNALGNLSKLPIYIDDAGMLNILELRARARRFVMKYGVQLIIIDYIQLIKAISEQKGLNRDQEMGIITRTLKAIAKELNVPVLAISALSRDVEKRGGDKRPQLHDVRESGNIESDADVVMFLYRPEYYRITQDEHGDSTHGLCEVIVSKHRNGSIGTAKLKFIGRFTKFKEWLHVPAVDYVAQQKNPLPPERDEPDTHSPF